MDKSPVALNSGAAMRLSPERYDAWYRTARGRWIGDIEYRLASRLLDAPPGASLLDVGCGSGYFSRRFAQAGLSVTGVDTDACMLDYARRQQPGLNLAQASALALPFPSRCFDYTMAITSLCFVEPPLPALQEMWRVTRKRMLVAVLNRHSLLYRRKRGRGGYAGARWDSAAELRRIWLPALRPAPAKARLRSAVMYPGAARSGRIAERLLPGWLLVGGVLFMVLQRPPAS